MLQCGLRKNCGEDFTFDLIKNSSKIIQYRCKNDEEKKDIHSESDSRHFKRLEKIKNKLRIFNT